MPEAEPRPEADPRAATEAKEPDRVDPSVVAAAMAQAQGATPEAAPKKAQGFSLGFKLFLGVTAGILFLSAISGGALFFGMVLSPAVCTLAGAGFVMGLAFNKRLYPRYQHFRGRIASELRRRLAGFRESKEAAQKEAGSPGAAEAEAKTTEVKAAEVKEAGTGPAVAHPSDPGIEPRSAARAATRLQREIRGLDLPADLDPIRAAVLDDLEGMAALAKSKSPNLPQYVQAVVEPGLGRLAKQAGLRGIKVPALQVSPAAQLIQPTRQAGRTRRGADTGGLGR